jgi:pyridoxal phosphate enzyme (YggS family)
MEISRRLAEVESRVAAACERAGRDRSDVALIVVTKTHPPERVRRVLECGALHVGENRVQEAAEKKAGLPSATWHLIGPLQRNKARLALELFDWIHTLDRPELAVRLQHLLAEHWPGRRLPVLIEVNTGSEPQKAGVLPEESEIEALVEKVLACDQLSLEGLMAIPPFDLSAEETRSHFRLLRGLREQLSQRHGLAVPHLSMGMSQDYEAAIEEGATMVRVGSAILGPRWRGPASGAAR